MIYILNIKHSLDWNGAVQKYLYAPSWSRPMINRVPLQTYSKLPSPAVRQRMQNTPDSEFYHIIYLSFWMFLLIACLWGNMGLMSKENVVHAHGPKGNWWGMETSGSKEDNGGAEMKVRVSDEVISWWCHCAMGWFWGGYRRRWDSRAGLMSWVSFQEIAGWVTAHLSHQINTNQISKFFLCQFWK